MPSGGDDSGVLRTYAPKSSDVLTACLAESSVLIASSTYSWCILRCTSLVFITPRCQFAFLRSLLFNRFHCFYSRANRSRYACKQYSVLRRDFRVIVHPHLVDEHAQQQTKSILTKHFQYFAVMLASQSLCSPAAHLQL